MSRAVHSAAGHGDGRRPMASWLRVAPTGFVLAWGGNHFTPLLHVYETLGGYAPWQANLLLGMYVLGIVPGMLLAAALSDRYGRKPLTIAGLLAAMIASSLLAAGMGSFVVLCIGRVLAGIGVGVGMSVGSSWIKELSDPVHDATATAISGAKRSSLTLTLGFAIGAGVTGSLAQFAPLPGQLPYAAHLLLCLLAAAALLTAPESLPRELRARGSLRDDLRVPSAAHSVFVRLVLPAAPWVFAAAGVAYAILPSTVEDRIGDSATIYATALTVLTLGVGALAQGTVGLLNRLTRGRALLVGMSGMTAGMILAAVASDLHSPVMVVGVAALLGASYGVCVVAGLIIAQSLADPARPRRDHRRLLFTVLPGVPAAHDPRRTHPGAALHGRARDRRRDLRAVPDVRGDRAAPTELVGAGSGGADGRSGCADAGSDVVNGPTWARPPRI